MLRDWPADKTVCPTSPPPLSEDLGEELGARERRKVNYALSPWGLCAFPSRGTEATSTEPAGNVVLRLFLGRVREQLLRPVHLN
jgi:hypothetical protein